MSFEEYIDVIPLELVDKVLGFIVFLKAIGVLFAIYLVIVIIKTIFTFKMNSLIKEVFNDVKKIKKKLKIK
jgi:hypothetical protein